ncbi:MAG: VRR-NUC domain-containing protein [Nitrosomonadaceae bacterium]
MSEDRLQAECFLWFHNSFPKLRGLLFHVPNGGKRDPREANKFKAMGVVAGIPDLVFCKNGKTYFFELKTDKGKLSDRQIDVHEKLVGEKFEIWIIRDFENFKNLIGKIISGKI